MYTKSYLNNFINQSRNLEASFEVYDLIGLLPNTLMIYSIFLLAILINILSLPSPFNLKYKTNTSEITGLLSSSFDLTK